MNRLIMFATALCSALLFSITMHAIAQNAEQKSVAVTVYNADLGVVKDVRNVDVPSGISEIRIVDVASRIDPTSVHIRLDGDVLEQNYQYDLVSLEKILQKYLDREIQLTDNRGSIVGGTLLSADRKGIVLRQADGGLLMLTDTDHYRISVGALPEGLITRPTLIWQVESRSKGKQDVEISYQTRGMNWHAEYVAVLDESDTKLDLNSWVSVANKSGATYPNATLKLVAGDVNLVSSAPNFRDEMILERLAANAAPEQQFQEKEFFEYHIYNLQRPTTIANNETKQISLFEAGGVKAEKKYLFRSRGHSRANAKVEVALEFANTKSNGLAVPMPKGKVRLYKADEGALEFIGEDQIDHTPRDETITLKIGDAFDIVAEEKQIDHKRISDKVNEQRFQVTLKNRKKEDVSVIVERHLGYNWEIFVSSLEYEKKDAQTVEYRVPIKAGGESKLIFGVRYAY